jgi:hypothetical protein
MKKVIDGALYNTETASKLGAWDNGLMVSDFNYLSHDLHKTKSGKYFLYVDTCFSDRDHIEPLSPSEAAHWAEEHLDGDDYIKIFGEPEEAASGREAINISLPVDIKRKLERMRSETGKSISAIIEQLVENL